MGSTNVGLAIAKVAGRLFKAGKTPPRECLRIACEPYQKVRDIDFDGAYHDDPDFHACLIAAIKPDFDEERDRKMEGEAFAVEVVDPFYLEFIPRSI